MLASQFDPSRDEGARADTAIGLIERACKQHHDLVAVTGVGDALTYGQLWARANGLAARLIGAGVARDQLVGLWSEQSSELLVGILGIWLAGAAYVPLDPRLPSQRLELIVHDGSIERIVASPASTSAAGTLGVPVEATSGPEVARAVPLPEVGAHDVAYVIYTSGSTGRPKGVVVEHHSLANFFLRMRATVGDEIGRRFVGTPSAAFDASITYLLYPLASGGTVATIGVEASLDPYLLADEIARLRPNVLLTLPSMLRMLVETRWEGDDGLEVWTGGERTAADVIEYVAARTSALCNFYGPTEATVFATMARLHAGDRDSPIAPTLAGTPCLLLDASGARTAPGEVGEIHLVGELLARGYLNDPVLTAERFVIIEVDGLGTVRAYRTGDTGRVREDGSLVILGRLDDQINLHGYRIEPGEIEARLVTHPAVVQAAATVRGTADGDVQLIAFVTTRRPVDPATLRDFVAVALPRHMVPVAIFELTSFPTGLSGKVDRTRLVAALDDVTPGMAAAQDRPDGETEVLSPRERQVVSLFSTVLSLDVASIGPDQDFFDLGGTSLKSLRLFLGIEDRFGVHLPLSTLTTASTPRALAAILDARGGGGAHGRPVGDAPRHEWERILNGLWCELLGASTIARSDSFFALGGTNDQATRLLAELRTQYGVEVTTAEFAASPTIKDLAALIGRRTVRSVLVPLTTTGTGTPIFFIAGAGGLAVTFLPLARLLGDDQVCYGIQAQGIERRAVPDLTLSQGARRYARTIREVQPHGPYLLGGHSLGGVHALKVAQLLEAEGEEVALLVIFDTPLSRGMVGRASTQRGTASGRSAAPRGLPKLSTVLHLPVVGIVPLRGTDQFEAFAALGEIQAILARRLKPWAGRATLFLSDEDEATQIEARWGRVLTGSWTSAKVPGGHIAMLEKQHIGVAASILRGQIDAVLARPREVEDAVRAGGTDH